MSGAGEKGVVSSSACSAESASTHWSVVLLAGQPGTPEAAAALERLCRTYWYPLYAHVRHRGYNVEEAKDLTQSFFAHLFEKNYLAHADRTKGTFRTFLLTALDRFLANDGRRAHAVKRGGGQVLISLDDDTAESRYAREATCDLTPDKIYERRWALTLLDLAMTRLEEEFAAANKARQFDLFRTFLTSEASQSDCAAVGGQLEMTAGAVAVAIHRLRQRYRELVREEIAHTVGNAADIEDEIHWLFTAMA
jgi:DNA-directed RNA polymerase specialized sigma24 family protein